MKKSTWAQAINDERRDFRRALRNKPAEEIRKDLEFDLHGLMGDLLSAAKATHSASRVSAMNLKYASALGPDLDAIANDLRDASETFRKIQAGVETLIQRAKKARV